MRYLLGIAILVAGIGYAQEFPISIAPGDQINPDVAWDGTNFWVVWADKRSGDFEIYGSRITPSGEILDTADVCLAAGTKFIMPSVDFGDSIGCVAFQYDTGFVYTTWDFYYSLFGVARFYSNGELIDSTTILVDWSPSYPAGGMIDYINIPICVFGKNNFFSFVEFGYCNWFECWECTEIQSLKEDRLVLIAGLPGFNSWAVTGIWNGKKFFTVWSQFPLGTCKVSGAFVQDSLGGQWLDPIQFKIRDENDFPPGIVNWDFGGYSARSKELAYSGSRYLLISETGWNNSKIWYDVLSDSGLPIDSLPTIIDNGDSVNQTYPICTYKDNKFYAVWQESSSVGVQLYGITVDTLGEIL
ncbi:MAG: hypothetical protein HY769_02485, partial [Candidatus Stahlbacteria bacterium]|nr:hypothetical protein [Candidatus Stahlbacteria bacterium]